MSETIRHIELLSPARDYEAGRAAVDYGADAIYVGGPSFGARQAATDSAEDVARLAEYARPFGVRVYAALNTLVFENELAEAEKTARELVAAGVDALIVQDTAFLRMGIGGAEFHASTQMCNTTAEGVRFLQEGGFSRAILERGLTLSQIGKIRAAAPRIGLECFIHGAICVAYSGRCYMSRSMSARSGNRGECSQPCRLTYDLEDGAGNTLAEGKHLLSVLDMNLTGRLVDLVDAGVDSFKIEGRLKDTAYVKNITAHYRCELDGIITARAGLRRASSGRTVSGFRPQPEKSFSRGATVWMLDGKRAGVASFDTPKAMGEPLGTVRSVARGGFTLDRAADISPGDGICFMAGGELAGTNVNRTEGAAVYPNRAAGLEPGVRIYRNHDRRFHAALDADRARRVVGAVAEIAVRADEITLRLCDEDGVAASVAVPNTFDPAADAAKAETAIKTQVARSGGTVFDIGEVAVTLSGAPMPFVPASELNALRRRATDALLQARVERPPVRDIAREDTSFPYPCDTLGGEGNVVNSLAERFYRDHGVLAIAPGHDLAEYFAGVTVMTTAYCLRRETGRCLKEKPGDRGDWFLRRGTFRYRLAFDCARCEMSVIKEPKE